MTKHILRNSRLPYRCKQWLLFGSNHHPINLNLHLSCNGFSQSHDHHFHIYQMRYLSTDVPPETTNQTQTTTPKSNPPKNIKPISLQKSKLTSQNNTNPIPKNEWICVPRVPRQASLDDMLYGLEKAIQQEIKRGIIDIDTLEASIINSNESHSKMENSRLNTEDEHQHLNYDSLPLWNPKTSLPSHMVLEARSIIKDFYKHSGWYLRFPNRSVVHALLEYSKHVSPVYCGYHPCYVLKCKNPRDEEVTVAERLGLDDTVLRMDNISHQMSEMDVLRLFDKFDLNYYGIHPTIEKCTDVSHSKSRRKSNKIQQGKKKTMKADNSWNIPKQCFLIRFMTPFDAKAAVRQLQSKQLKNYTVTLFQYPKQILPKHNEIKSK